MTALLMSVHNGMDVRYRALFLFAIGVYYRRSRRFSVNGGSMSSILPFPQSDTPFQKLLGT